MKTTTQLALLILAITGAMAPTASACSTCFGDPDSAMAKGVVMGVFVMVGVVGFVLAGIAGTGLYWIQRSRRLSRTGDDSSGTSSAIQP